ncbi:hypothetical protein GCM10022215_39000 [Nocardioides fonticola]|uniref:M23ase beta-sheet core domain-containing protein n=1 Tax=Nocardioides fonticola TaxID=450363 RepID=A0ABP7Y0M8_9ACTN
MGIIPTPLERSTIRRRRSGALIEPALDARTLEPLPVTYPWGVKDSNYDAGRHTGEDHACVVGSLAISPVWGEVVQASEGGGSWGWPYGTIVVVRSTGGRDLGFCHLSRTRVRVGQRVRPGTVVGETGATGKVSGPHLHFEVRPAGGRYESDVDPIVVKRISTTEPT